MLLEKDVRGKTSLISTLEEGFRDILDVMKEQQEKWGENIMEADRTSQKDGTSSHDSDKAGELENEEGPETVIQIIIGKVFDQHRHYQAQLSDLQHILSMKTLQVEDLESLKLDLEILNEEKELTESDLNSMKQQLDSVHLQLIQKQKELSD